MKHEYDDKVHRVEQRHHQAGEVDWRPKTAVSLERAPYNVHFLSWEESVRAGIWLEREYGRTQKEVDENL